ncbi:hypothetical protein [Roseovarius atlanticus]|uniref:hypothetical protein n=1 Tax=Roseovarius atlanticus TaxID=1641875 RepID=UPI001C986AD6|nr:hypothetical protein [Roseovarius atlanticus]MBY5990078.1 hypothetical protein [Roseovarius atlanticus]MBY6126624.1 hypothetical protein [Roseovarius atlanticus]MBY6151118.1 hypothetical protein [Roseovarius atlanticus]
MLRRLAWGLVVAWVSACTQVDDLDEAPVYLGNFHLGHNVVAAPNLQKGPLSREASKADWIAAMTQAVDERFSRQEGTRLYHLGITLEGYVLAKAGIPVVAAPKSALVLKVTAWDDAKKARLNETPELITVVEGLSGDTVVGSGLTRTAEEQMQVLTQKGAKLIENWLVRQNNAEGWFEDDGRPARTKARARAAEARAAASEEERMQAAAKEALEKARTRTAE